MIAYVAMQFRRWLRRQSGYGAFAAPLVLYAVYTAMFAVLGQGTAHAIGFMALVLALAPLFFIAHAAHGFGLEESSGSAATSLRFAGFTGFRAATARLLLVAALTVSVTTELVLLLVSLSWWSNYTWLEARGLLVTCFGSLFLSAAVAVTSGRFLPRTTGAIVTYLVPSALALSLVWTWATFSSGGVAASSDGLSSPYLGGQLAASVVMLLLPVPFEAQR